MAGKQVYMVTDKVTKEVKDMVGEYNEWLRDKVVQSKFFLPKVTQLTLFSSGINNLKIQARFPLWSQ